ncbi:MAG: hypothetical protein NTW87_19905 [Planctomycetota bacterium]|nr:hypothetical protein [Planctomycetota bacterium]
MALVCPGVAAEGDDDAARPPEEDIRYDIIKVKGETYRFDRKTGEFLKLIMTKDGVVGVREKVRIVDRERAADRPKAASQPPVIEGDDPGMAQFDENRKKKKTAGAAEIEYYDDQGNNITYQITDPEREAARGVIAAYQNSMSFVQTLDLRDRIIGNILVRNNGDKKLKVLELTLVIPVVGREKAEEHRFLFVDKAGFPAPPQPASGGKEGLALLHKVDLPSPPGRVMGSPVLKISYMKFGE